MPPQPNRFSFPDQHVTSHRVFPLRVAPPAPPAGVACPPVRLARRRLAVTAAATTAAVTATLLAPFGRPSAAQGAPLTRSVGQVRSAPIAQVRYEVTFDSLTTRSRQFAVAMQFKVVGPGPVILALPAWSPGHYELLWFARRVSSFSPMINGTPLPWRQLDYQTWELDGTKPGSTVSVAFDYRGDTIDRAVAWTRSNFAFFNGTNLFMYPVGRGFDWPARVILHTQSTWKVATGMKELMVRQMGGMHHDYDIEHVFEAPNYHDLVDMPFFIGDFDLDSLALPPDKTDRTEHWVRAATYPASADSGRRMARLLGWLVKIAPAHASVFRDVPWKSYTVLQITDTVVNGGGLEHQNSQLDEIATSEVDAPWLPWLYAHEMFHSWNVKRLRPADLVPYRYDDAQPSAWLWVAEGITDYYADLGVTRSGVNDSAALFSTLGGTISQVAAATPTALSDASLRPWIKPMDGSAGLYYPKGKLAGFMLDLLIRDASDNHHSLDDVMRSLYRTTYKHGRGFTPTDWWAAVARAAGGAGGGTRHAPRIPFSEVRRRYVEGRDLYPWDSLLVLAGLHLRIDTTYSVRLGVATADDSAGVRILFVDPSGAAAAAGVKTGDVLIRIGDIDVRNDSAFAAVRSKYATSTGTLPTSLRRAGQAMTVQIPIRAVAEVGGGLVPVPDASAKAVRIRHGLLTGTTD